MGQREHHLFPSIESVEGLENVEKIAAVDGIDMIAYGHSDLSAQLGVHLGLEHPKFKAAVRRIATACNAHGKLARGSAETEAQIEEYWQLGCKGNEPAGKRPQHLSRRDESARGTGACAAEIDRGADAVSGRPDG